MLTVLATSGRCVIQSKGSDMMLLSLPVSPKPPSPKCVSHHAAVHRENMRSRLILQLNRDLFEQQVKDDFASILGGLAKIFVAEVIEIGELAIAHLQSRAGPCYLLQNFVAC